MSVKNTVSAIPLTTIASTALIATYQAINASGLPKACFLVRIVNGGTTAITISYDGATDHEYLRAGSELNLNLQANAQPNNSFAHMKAGTIVYVKGTAGASGDIALSGYYQPQGL